MREGVFRIFSDHCRGNPPRHIGREVSQDWKSGSFTMSLPAQDQIAATQKANTEAFFALASKVIDGVEKLANLNLQATGSGLARTQAIAIKTVESAGDPQEWIALQGGLFAPLTEKLMSYGVNLFDIASTMRSAIMQTAEAQFERCSERMQAITEEAAKRAPAGSAVAIEAWKSALGATGTLFDTLQKASHQAMQVTGSNLEALTATVTKATQRGADLPPQ
ncbi:TIGR01841 family phasin [Paraburkholderia sp. JHI2823]|uniref:TIGR01841 family phasin n=1 Tax=Paraburkholderia sp. JHI2823 TaxID=3112960 RepID=UPI003180F29E